VGLRIALPYNIQKTEINETRQYQLGKCVGSLILDISIY